LAIFVPFKRAALHTMQTDDHDGKGSLDMFRQYLEPDLYRAVDLRNFRLLFLNAMDETTVAFLARQITKRLPFLFQKQK
jgi:hypothetical protein